MSPVAIIFLVIAALAIFIVVRANQGKNKSFRHTAPLTIGEQERVTAVVTQSKIFMDASMLLVDFETLNSNKTQQVGACLYLIGAVDFLSRHNELSINGFNSAAVSALRNFGLTEPNAISFCASLPAISVDPFGRDAMVDGGRSVQAWLSGSDPNAPVRLSELVSLWVANPEKGFG